MSAYEGHIYIGTILLERNRWARGKEPSYLVSEWLERFAEAGFDGVELWENHAALAQPEELEALERPACPIAILNTYAPFGEEGQRARERAAALANRLSAGGAKYNLGRDEAARDSYIFSVREWAAQLPDRARVLCECHPGTTMEDPSVAADVLAELGDPKFQAMHHALAVAEGRLTQWMRLVGDRTTHVHVQMRDEDGAFLRLDRTPELVRRVLDVLHGEGFAGSFTLEFTEGTGAPDENPEMLFANALRDLEFLRENLA